ncbi:LuxR family transcriptional regulator [Nocardioides sp.]|uniref:helix-turn-helix transcriptional regulator n=1 Tax=Nocardioides sp. TaxID=35761 RepID=UPI00260EB07A|nr:LuxR family transcriptional regulator [Nocardioides sp.]
MTGSPQLADGLLEREAEWRRMQALLTAVQAGQGAQLCLLGPPGAGKSSLLAALVERARADGLRVLLASAGPLESRSPFGLARRLFTRELERLTPAEIAGVSTGLARTAVEHLIGSSAEPVELGDMLASLTWLLRALARLGPVLVVADDVQWADEESVLLLGSLREQLDGLTLGVVLAAREVSAETRQPALAEVVAAGEVLRPEALTATAVGAVLASCWGGEVGAEVAQAAHEVSGGNPFLVTALARLLAERAPGERGVAALRAAVPGTVIDAVVQRIAALPEPARDLARAVAILDGSTLTLAAALAGTDLETAALAADRLRAAGIFAAEGAPTFRHGLLRSATYATIGHDTREALHRRAAALLAGTDLNAAAAQLLSAEPTGDCTAADVLARAGRDALDAGAPQSAVALLRRAVAEPPTAAELPRLLLDQGLAEMRTLDAACVETLDRALAVVTAPEDRAEAALALARAYAYAGFHALAADVLAEACDALRGTDSELELEVEAAFVGTAMLVSERRVEARRLLAARTDLTGSTRGERLFLIQQMMAASAANQPATVLFDLAEKVIGDWPTSDQSPESTEWVWPRLLLAAMGRLTEVRRLTDDGFAKAAANGSMVGFLSATFVRGSVELWSGDLIEAESRFRAMLEHGRALNGGVLVETLAGGGLAQALAFQGRVEEAMALLAPFPEESGADAPIEGMSMLAFCRAVVRQLAGDDEGALASALYLGRLVAELDCDSPTWVAWRAPAITALWTLGRVEEARAMAAEHLALCEQAGAATLLAEALHLAGVVGEDAEHSRAMLERSVEVAQSVEGRLHEVMARMAYGAFLRRTGQRAEAREHLRQARWWAEQVHAGHFVALADSELAAAGVRAGRLDLFGSGALTASELRVCELAVQGLRNRDIAQRLYITTKTVEVHLSRAYRKLGIVGRADLALALEA